MPLLTPAEHPPDDRGRTPAASEGIPLLTPR
ncbi:hypothetical protein SAMN05421879_102162 [Ornithinimicrobium cerasi]|uniref:Uncharacterized protein n=1 Tax=Ornithinimicrobium cerasi TaxID=2248773 RepID=A0A285VI67_9MICO|nr:hypothetical protein SAMN05421879_102162 [Ornithinimicrobium cerasi]